MGDNRYETKERRSWKDMRQRCLNPRYRDYHLYGGRGIRICPEWDNYETFLNDMRRKPSPELTLERVDNDGNYEPANCIWATRAEQGRNTRKVILTWEKVHQIRDLHKREIYNHRQLAYFFDVSPRHIKEIIWKRCWNDDPPKLKGPDLFA